MYLVYIDGYINDYVDEITQSQAGNEGVGAIPHALVLVYNPQEGGVAHKTDHEHQRWNYSVDIFEIVANRGRYEAHRRLERLFHDRRLISSSHCLCISLGGVGAFSGDGAGGAVEAGGLEGGVDEHNRERVHLRLCSGHLAHSSGCHTDHQQQHMQSRGGHCWKQLVPLCHRQKDSDITDEKTENKWKVIH